MVGGTRCAIINWPRHRHAQRTAVPLPTHPEGVLATSTLIACLAYSMHACRAERNASGGMGGIGSGAVCMNVQVSMCVGVHVDVYDDMHVFHLK